MNQPSMLRQPNGIHIPQSLGQPAFHNINTPHLISQQGQPQPPQQHQPQSNPMSMLPGHPNSTPAMGLLGGGAQPNGASPNFNLQLQHANNQIRRNQLVQQGMNPGLGAPGQPPMNGIGPNTMAFQNNMIRRVPSQPQQMNQVGHPGGMHQVMGGVPMAGLNGVPTQVRRMQNIQQPMHQQPPLSANQPPMQPDLVMLRQSHVSNPAAFGPHVGRSTSAQAHPMPNLQSSANFPPSLPTMAPSYQTPSLPQQQQQHPTQQSQLATSPHPPHTVHTPGQIPGALAAQQGIQQPFNRARMTPDQTMLLNLQNQQMTPNLSHAGQRMPPGSVGGGYAFPANNPPNPMGDVQQSLQNGIMGTPGSTNRLITPAQTLEQLQGNEGFGMAPPPQVAPARPPSQQRVLNYPMPHVPQPPHHTPGAAHASPRHHGQQIQTQQRPQSQPQVPQGSPRQAGMGHTPRMTSQQIAHNAGVPQTRIPSLPGQQPAATAKPPTPSASGHVPMKPGVRPPQTPAATPGGPPPAPSGPPPPAGSVAPQAQPPRYGPPTADPEIANLQLQGKVEHARMGVPAGLGQSINLLLKFSAALAHPMEEKAHLSFWDEMVKEYFTDDASLKITLWKDNRREEAKPFEIGVTIIPRFFLVTSQSGVKSMTLNLDGSRERLFTATHCSVECTMAMWTFKYTNGYIVTLRGPLTAHVFAVPTPTGYVHKFDTLHFDANFHDKYLNVEAILGQRIPDSPGTPTPQFVPLPLTNGHIDPNDDRRYDEPRLHIERATVPAEPVNAFGIPQATMRCLELAESVGQMAPLIEFASKTGFGPLDSLSKYAQKIREDKSDGPLNGNVPPGHGKDGQGSAHVNRAPSGPSTIYPSTGPSGAQPPQAAHPQNVPPTGTPKPSKALPPGQAQTASTPGPASASTPGAAPTPSTATTTPAMQHANLKRKATTQGPEATTSGAPNSADTSAKRPTRKRGRTTGGG